MVLDGVSSIDVLVHMFAPSLIGQHLNWECVGSVTADRRAVQGDGDFFGRCGVSNDWLSGLEWSTPDSQAIH